MEDKELDPAQNPDLNEPETELSEEELDEASGGNLFKTVGYKNIKFRPHLNFSELNPQPLPPGPPPPDLNIIKTFGNH